MTAKLNPPFRAEHIGSLLRTQELKDAFKKRRAGDLQEDAFNEIQEKAIREVVELQQRLGLKVVTDGEYRRASYWGHWVDAIDGLGVATSLFKFYDETGTEQEFIAADCVGELKKSSPISTEEFKFLKSVATAEPKITMPSPSTLHFWRMSDTIKDTPYESDAEYMDALCSIFSQEIKDLASLGCRYVQLDEVPLIMLGNPAIRDKVVDLGGNPEELLDLYIEGMNQAVADRGDVVAGMHVCRGNFKGRWLTEGGYDEIAETVFKRVNVDAFMLEYDNERSGSFEPLKHVPDDKMVVLGLVSSKVPEIEQAEYLESRIAEAAKYIDRERLAISPQCGFASTVAGNPVEISDEEAKLSNMINVANSVWSDA